MNAATASPAPGWPVMSMEQAEQLLTAPGTAFEMEEATIRGVRMRVWKAAPKTLRDIFLNGRNTYGERTFLVFEDERCTFEGFSRAAVHLAHHLIGLGVKKGDRVAIVMSNLPEWPVAFFAGVLTGAIVTPLNGWWTGDELEYAFQDSGSKIGIFDRSRFERFAPHLPSCPDLERVIVSRAPGVDHPMASPLESVIGPTNSWGELADLPLPDTPLDPEDDATIFYTSGTTGRPKGALGTHRGPCTSMYIAGYAGARSFLRRGEAPPTPGPHNPQRRALLSIPFFHVTGCFAVLCRSVWDGAMIALMRRFEPEAAMQVIEKERITAFGGVPTIPWQVI